MESGKGERVEVTVDRVLEALGEMMMNDANGPGDCVVTHVAGTSDGNWWAWYMKNRNRLTGREELLACGGPRGR